MIGFYSCLQVVPALHIDHYAVILIAARAVNLIKTTLKQQHDARKKN